MPGNGNPSSPVNLANALTTLRLCSVPVLLWLAWQGESVIFVCVLVGALLTDLVDGTIARWLNQASEFGCHYDSLADGLVWLSLPVCVYWLEPDFVREEAIFVWMVIVSYTVPMALGLLRFGRLPSLHTIISKCSAVVLPAALVVVFMDGPYLPFRICAVVYVLVGIEEIAIILLLPEWRSNVPTLRHALAFRRHHQHPRSEHE